MADYSWTRYWHERSNLPHHSGNGFLLDPRDWPYSNNLMMYSDLPNLPFLVLLGEPGMGKSYEYRKILSDLKDQIDPSTDLILSLDLNEYTSEDRLIRNLFETSEFIAWINQEYRLHIVLDSLDEAMLFLRTIPRILGNTLTQYQPKNLYVHVFCRTGDWPVGLENQIQSEWGKDNVGVYVLASLTRQNVETALATEGIESDAFFRELTRIDCVPLAMKPVTLNMLLRSYLEANQLPGSQVELYELGCRLLCTESNRNRKDARLIGQLNPDERMTIAAHIAVLMILGNLHSMSLSDIPQLVPNQLHYLQVCSGEAIMGRQRMPITREALTEVLSTSLFTTYGENEFGWAHQSYAEYLTAWYLSRHEVTTEQLKSLFINCMNVGDQLVPQLTQTAMWLAAMNDNFRHLVWDIKPQSLLNAPAIAMGNEDRQSLVELVLASPDAVSRLRRDMSSYHSLAKLNHPNLANQLRCYINNRDLDEMQRITAIDIAEAAQLTELQEDLKIIVLDSTEPFGLRLNAAETISKVADSDVRQSLAPILSEPVSLHPNSDLRGAVLSCLWPEHIGIQDILDLLVMPDGPGSYSQFFFDFVDSLSEQDIGEVIRWVKSIDFNRPRSHRSEDMLDDILAKAWSFVPDKLIDGILADLLLHLSDRFYLFLDGFAVTDFRSQIGVNPIKRRRILAELVALVSEDAYELNVLRNIKLPIVQAEDVDWIIFQLENKSEKETEAWCVLLHRVSAHLTDEQEYRLFRSHVGEGECPDYLRWLFGSIAIDSALAHHWQEDEQYRLESEQQKTENIRIWQSRFNANRESVKNHDPNGWQNLVSLMMQDHYRDGYDYVTDITAWKIWPEIPADEKITYAQYALSYLEQQDKPSTDECFLRYIDTAARIGFLSIKLINKVSPQIYSEISDSMWHKWACAIVTSIDTRPKDEVDKRVLQDACKYAYDEVQEGLLLLIDHDNRVNKHVFCEGLLDFCWCTSLESAVFSMLTSGDLTRESYSTLLFTLLRNNSLTAREYAQELLISSDRLNSDLYDQELECAKALVLLTDDACWGQIWQAIKQYPEFGAELFQSIADIELHNRYQLMSKLSEIQIANLFIWLSEKFPRAEDPSMYNGAVPPREQVARLRDESINYLGQQSTQEAYDAVHYLKEQMPSIGDWLTRIELQIHENMNREMWNPPTPEQLLKMVEQSESRFVNNEQELVDVLLESLRRLEHELHNETPAVWDLWNTDPMRPKTENEFSDYVKRFLNRDLKERGIIVNREVEFRRSGGPAKGERTDIHVNAVGIDAKNHVNTLTVVVEVKGCWHSELKTAMETQLVDRYLHESSSKSGIYLVGWYKNPKWDKDDSRWESTPKRWSIEDAREHFDTQAEELSQNGLYVKAYVMDTALR